MCRRRVFTQTQGREQPGDIKKSETARYPGLPAARSVTRAAPPPASTAVAHQRV